MDVLEGLGMIAHIFSFSTLYVQLYGMRNS